MKAVASVVAGSMLGWWRTSPPASLESICGEVLGAVVRNDAKAKRSALAKAKANGYVIACHHNTDEDWRDEPEADVVIWYGCRIRVQGTITKGGKFQTYIMNCFITQHPTLECLA